MRKLSRILAAVAFVLVAATVGPAEASTATYVGRPMIWINAANGKCLGVAAGTMTPGTKVIVWPCNGEPDQKWVIGPGSGGSVIRNVKDQAMCLSVAANVPTNQAHLVIWRCKGSDNADQRWDVFDDVVIPGSPLPAGSAFIGNGHGMVMGMINFPFGGPQVVQENIPLTKDMGWFGFFA
jgi:hypothetical protein